ncbi:peptidase M56 [Sphingomonas sp. MAH-20]|uniref:Peptidase M56 n=1 Tax=Sphingomonas horti TaxID=2682842 RepID=A0A6I4IYW4_9SPHN|nr:MULTISPECIES: M56 family metallopeptidase [Sphingomonas]MBA2918442.1 peptidase M56 [Sphingomonas sp. CGMCC 1.13658]MVO77409.1 peptidase M56 [Sphingomonas horti]
MISWAIETFVASTLLMLVVLAVRRPVARHFGPHIAYGLWLLPALRMLLPPLPETVAPVPIHVLPANVEALLAAAAALHTDAGTAAVDAPSVNWLLLFGCAWAAGALVFLFWHIWTYRRFVRAALADATQLPRFDRGRIEVCASPAARGPFAAGIFLKTVVLPEDYRRRYERDELRLAIEHEVQHHRRCDMSANFAALVVLALHWWNPIAHFAHRAFRVDQELACDALVLAQATPFERHAYGSALLKSACDRLPVAACALGAGDDLKRRLTMMKIYRWNASRARLGSMIATGLVGGGLLLTASNGIAAETTKRVEQQVRTILPVAAPLPPVPPAAPPAPHAAVPPQAPAAPDAPPVPPALPALPAVPAVPASLVSISWSSDGQDQMLDADDIREIQESAREAQREAWAAAREAQADALADAREAAAEARASAREAVRAHPVTVTKNCPKGTPFMAKVSDDGHAQVLCGAFSPVDRAKLRKQIIASLEQTRASLAASLNDEWARRTRENALASIDREIVRLKSEK